MPTDAAIFEFETLPYPSYKFMEMMPMKLQRACDLSPPGRHSDCIARRPYYSLPEEDHARPGSRRMSLFFISCPHTMLLVVIVPLVDQCCSSYIRIRISKKQWNKCIAEGGASSLRWSHRRNLRSRPVLAELPRLCG